MGSSMATRNRRLLNKPIIVDVLELSHDSISKCPIPYLVAAVLVSLGNV